MGGRKLVLQKSGRRVARAERSKHNNFAMGQCLSLNRRRRPVCLERVRRKRSCSMSQWFEITRFRMLQERHFLVG